MRLFLPVALVLCAAALCALPGFAAELESPYTDPSAPWLRGNLHTHTTNSDGRQAPQAVVDEYAGMGYDFLMLSDHDQLTDPASVDPKGMVMIPGNEISAKGPHLLHVNATKKIEPDRDRQKVLDAIAADRGFAVMNHPNWTKNYNHCDLALLEQLNGYAGIEIFNGVILVLEGSEYATDKWDRLLTQGKRVWGFATDDSHDNGHRGLGWVMVQTGDRTPDGIADAMRRGSFYASTGVTFDEISVEGLTVRVRAANAQKLRVFGSLGRMQATADGTEITHTVNPEKAGNYVRVEAYGAGSAIAWTQPLFVKN